MKRSYVETVSVTSVKSNGTNVSLQYQDLLNDSLTELELPQTKIKEIKATKKAPIEAKNR